MQRLKILLGISLLVISFFAVLASKVTAKSPVNVISYHHSRQTHIEREKIEVYLLRQKKLRGAVNTYFQKAIKSGVIVGAGVSIVSGDSIVVSNGYGKRNINGVSKVNSETVFRLGSLSKGFASVLAADLKNENLISWDDKISNYIPEFKFGDVLNTQKVKLSHVLSHTSGTPYHSFTNLVEAGLPMQTIASRFNEVTPISEPGNMYSYQNAMFSLSQIVMEKATGQNTKTLLQERFFNPLGMTTVSMNHIDLIGNKNVALPHSRSGRNLSLNNRYYNAVAAGGINASALDMAKWMRFLLGHNPEVLPKSAIQEVFRPFVSVNNHRKYYQRWPGHIQSSYGFGWRIHQFQEAAEDKEFTMWHHGGSVNNYRNEIALYPESDLGICVLLNSNSKLARTVIPDLHAIVKEIYDDTIFDNPLQKVAGLQLEY